MRIDNSIKIIRSILILIFLFWGISYLSINGYKKELKSRNFIENVAINAYEFPSMVKVWIRVNFKKPEQAIDIEVEEGLYQIGKFPANAQINDSLYLLYYKYLGEEKGKVFLQNILNGDIAFSWDIPLSEIISDLREIDKDLVNKYFNHKLPINLTSKVKKNLPSIQISAPIISNDSSLIFHCGTLGYLYKIDKKSKIIWKSKKLVHHSIEVDELNNIWTCSLDLTNKTANHHEYREDAILCLSPDGNEKYFFPLTQIFNKNNLYKKLIGSSPNYQQEYGLDPYHLNDVLPVNYNGRYWRKGDVLLSLRHQSMVVLFRPSSDSIIWFQQGPWLGQHDINIVNDSVISVFNNNILFFNKQVVEPELTSNVAFHNMFDGKTVFKYNNIFTSPFQGRQTYTSNNEYIVEQTGGAKYYILDSLENIKGKFYIPYFSDSTKAMNPTWAGVYMLDNGNFIRQ